MLHEAYRRKIKGDIELSQYPVFLFKSLCKKGIGRASTQDLAPYAPTKSQPMPETKLATVEITILRASDLPAKDRNLLGHRTSSDPYIEVYDSKNTLIARTKTISRNLNPTWNETFQLSVIDNTSLTLKLYDEDILTAADLMGTLQVQISPSTPENKQWYEVDPKSANHAKGRVELLLRRRPMPALVRGNSVPLNNTDHLYLGCAWDLLAGKAIDLDTSCVAISRTGKISKDDSVYYGHRANLNRSIVHSGDERTGERLGDDESIMLQLDRIPDSILALYLILTVATPGMRIGDIGSTQVRIRTGKSKPPVCYFAPSHHAMANDSSAMFLVRISRNPASRWARNPASRWVLTTMEESHPTARDYGLLIPHIKHYTKDLIPRITIDPTERVAILRKGGEVRLVDYCRTLPKKVTFGLAWDITNGVNIDLDVSAVCLDASLQLVDTIWFRALRSKDQSVIHHGDEREGDSIGDDEMLDIYLEKVNPVVQYIGFVVNSYSGQELDDVARSSCHLFDPSTNDEIASYAMTNAAGLNGFTALVMACLIRVDGGWNLRIISESAQGKTFQDNVEDLQRYLQQSPSTLLPDPEEEIDLSNCDMPETIPLEEEVEIDFTK